MKLGIFSHAVAALVVMGATTGWAQERTAEQIASDLPKSVLQALEGDTAQVRKQALTKLYEMSPDGVVTTEMALQRAEIARSQARAARLARVLVFDLDGDGAVGEAEFTRASAALPPAEKASALAFRAEADLDRDGVVTFAEAAARIEKDLDKPTSRSSRDWSVLALDMDRDGRVDAAEVNRAIDALAALVQDAAMRRRGAALRSTPGECFPPTPSAAAEVVVISGYGGDAISPVAAAGQDMPTTAATLRVEPGDSPIWVFVNAHEPMIWNVTGATGRIERFVVQPNLNILGPGAGVVGVAADRVDFLPANACFKYLTSSGGGAGVIARGKITEATGKPVTTFIAAQSLSEYAIPSGEKLRQPNGMIIDLTVLPNETVPGPKDYGPPSGPEKKTRFVQGLDFKMVKWRLSETKPGGVLDIDVKDVVAPRPVEEFDVLPELAGVLQLMEEGAVWRTSDGYFFIQKPIKRMPPGLQKGHQAKFILAEGVPLPEGGPWNLEVVAEKTGECLSGLYCQ